MKNATTLALALTAAIAVSACGTPIPTEGAVGPVTNAPTAASMQAAQVEQIRFQQAIRSAELRQIAAESRVEQLRAVQRVTSDSLRSLPSPTVEVESLRFRREVLQRLTSEAEIEVLRALERLASDSLRS